MISQSRFYYNQIKMILSGILIGALSGTVVAMFRFIIQGLTEFMTKLLGLAKHDFKLVLVALVIVVTIGLIGGKLLSDVPDIKGSGIPQVEGQLQGLVEFPFWPVLWRKFVAGSLAIGSGLYLGREGPSIQLGSTVGQGVAKLTNQVGTDRKVLISSGAAAGLSAAFNAPIASTMFVLEEIYHNFSTNIWVVSLSASITADFVATYAFGLKPVLYMPSSPLPLNYFPLAILLGIVLGVLGRAYQFVILNINVAYDWINKINPKLRPYAGIIPLVCLIPLGMYLPILMGGGSRVILSLPTGSYSVIAILGFLIVRFFVSIFNYGSSLPGGIFLPILCLGALIGAVVGKILIMVGLVSPHYFSSFVIMGMAGYFAGISKAPFTAILLITEMVGSLTHMLGLAVVSLVAYIVVDVLRGGPVYADMLDAMMKVDTQEFIGRTSEIIQTVFVGANADGRKVKDIKWPKGALITKVKRNGHEFIPTGDMLIMAGDTMFVNVADKNRYQLTKELQKIATKK